MSNKLTAIVLAAALSTGGAAAGTFDFNPDFSIAVDAGSTGTGFEFESRLNPMFQVRAGFNWMPHFEFPMHFSIEVGDDGDPGYDSEGRSRFDRMAGYLEEMTGFQIDQQIDMIGEPHFHNFKLLIDVFPFKNKHWYFTAGFYAGPSVIGRAYNRTEDMTTLMSVAMYNNIYDKVYEIEYNDETELNGVFLGLELPPAVNRKILNSGRMGMHVGDFADGTRYVMEPDADNMVKAVMKVNSFKPYLGAGFNGLIDKKNDRLHFATDCGVMFWGGSPKVYTHDGTEITSLKNINGQVGKYVNISNKFKVFPVVNLSISYRLFNR